MTDIFKFTRTKIKPLKRVFFFILSWWSVVFTYSLQIDFSVCEDIFKCSTSKSLSLSLPTLPSSFLFFSLKGTVSVLHAAAISSSSG